MFRKSQPRETASGGRYWFTKDMALPVGESVMILRTPRRRISPRTKRRYRAIKNFLQRALGNSSQPDIKINSSIAVNVTNLNRKIVHLEKQVNEVSRHLLSVESIPRKESEVSIPIVKDSIDAFKEQESLPCEGYASDTKVLYKTSQRRYKNDDSDSVMKLDLTGIENLQPGKMRPHYNDVKLKNNKNQVRTTEEHHPRLSNYKSKSVYENFTSAYSTSSYHSLVNPKNYQHIQQSDYSDLHYSRKHKKLPDLEKIMERDYERDRKYPELKRKGRSEKYDRNHVQEHGKKQRNRHISRELDSDYIANIIKRQYRPIKMFGKHESDISQFSVPVCRDQEYKLNENIIQESVRCSCYYDHTRPSDCRTNHDCVNDQRSICDTRLYSSKRQYKNKRKYINNYNDSTLYDLIPVKEKSSPKSRRKFEKDRIRSFEYCKEVPPSPRTLRPKLNLKVQHHTETDEDTDIQRRNRRRSHSRSKRRNTNSNQVYSTDSYEKIEQMPSQIPKINKKSNAQHNINAMSSQAPIFNNKQTSIIHDTSLNNFQHTNTSDKTDKALCEIKDILETFLLEIKKESSNCGTSNVSNKSNEKYLSDHRKDIPKTNPDANQNSYNNCGMEHCSLPPPYMSPYPSPYCYPILPICPINCMQNGYVLPSPSYTCATCANKEEYLPKNTNITTNTTNNNETEQLIKEIYNFIRQTPKSDIKKEYHDKDLKGTKQQAKQKKLTSRSIGGSSMVSQHDAKVGTPKLKCYSKSCEAISSPISDVYYNRTSPSYSDTILEKLSLEETETESESEISSGTTIKKKNKTNRFTKVLRSFGLLRKKANNDTIEELSESESTDEVDVKMNPPFKQNIKNYMMHGQEYFHPPPVPLQHPHCHNYHGHTFEHAQLHGGSYSHYPDEIQPQIPQYNIYSPRETHYATHPSAPPYPNYLHEHHHMQPQVPLCLKEIEVKSMATQSERKMSFFKKFTKKIQPAPSNNNAPSPPKNSFTQTANDKPGFWKTLQMKQQLQLEQQQQQQRLSKQNKNLDPMNFSLKTQQELAQGDMKMRNAMLKKLFHKRNPFSPGNLIVRTILGKDKSSFGEPPKMYRPRMFF